MDITGRLVRLRALRAADAERMTELLADPEVVRNLDHWSRPPHTLEESQAWIAAPARPDWVRWAIETVDGGEYLGQTGLDTIDLHNRRCEWGIWLGPPDVWGRGYGTEACMLAVEYAFRHLGVEKVCLHLYAGNDRARRVYEKAGFSSEGVLRRHQWRDGELVDVEVMAVFRDSPLYRERMAQSGGVSR